VRTVFFVLNKVDTLDSDETGEACSFCVITAIRNSARKAWLRAMLMYDGYMEIGEWEKFR